MVPQFLCMYASLFLLFTVCISSTIVVSYADSLFLVAVYIIRLIDWKHLYRKSICYSLGKKYQESDKCPSYRKVLMKKCRPISSQGVDRIDSLSHPPNSINASGLGQETLQISFNLAFLSLISTSDANILPVTLSALFTLPRDQTIQRKKN